MADTIRRITYRDRDRHERFFAFVAGVFRIGDTFPRWAERGGWDAGYEVFAIERDGRLLSTVGRQHMRLVLEGKELEAYQLGAVASLPDHRRHGFSGRLLTGLMDESDARGRPVILFANPSVLDFYPRFGFARLMQKRFAATTEIEPAARPAPVLDLDKAGDRAYLAELCARAGAPGTAFSARDYYSTLLWNLTHKPRSVFRVDEVDAALVASVEEERLMLHDVIAVRRFDLRPFLPRLISSRVSRLEFGFDPEAWWPHPSNGDDMDSHFFVRGLPILPSEPFRFPDLAQT